MKRYYKEENGKRVWFDGILKSNDKQIINPSEEQILSEGWIQYVPPVAPQPTEEEKLEQVRNIKLTALNEYDCSEAVNICYINHLDNTVTYWADKNERSSLKSAVQDCILSGREYYRLDLREVGLSVEIKCESLIQMLSALEVYAIDCYNTTTDHMFAIKQLNSIEDIESYDYTTGYPDKLTFNL